MELVRKRRHSDHCVRRTMASIEKIDVFFTNLNLNLRNKSAIFDCLELRLNAIALGLWAIDLAGVRAVRETVYVVSGLLILFLLILVRFRVWWEFDRDT